MFTLVHFHFANCSMRITIFRSENHLNMYIYLTAKGVIFNWREENTVSLPLHNIPHMYFITNNYNFNVKPYNNIHLMLL